MTGGHLSALQVQLKQAEEAEAQLQKLKHLAMEAPKLEAMASDVPKLKAELERLGRSNQREQAREKELQNAQAALAAILKDQERLPEALSRAVKGVYDLYGLLKEIAQRRQITLQHLARVDRIDYEIELESAQENARLAGQNPGSLPQTLSKQHGEERVNEMFNELMPDFEWYRGCNLSSTVHRELAEFVLAHISTGSEQSK